MTYFTFKPIQTLVLSKDDNPRLAVKDGVLTITATKEGETLLISAPMPMVASTPVVKTTVKNQTTGKIQQRRHGSHLPSGEQHPLSKLTEKEVREIRAMAADASIRNSYSSHNKFLVELGRMYKVHFTTIAHIINRVTWKHI